MALFSQMEMPEAAYNGEDDQGVACVSLYRAVLDRAVDDVLLSDVPASNIPIRDRAERWLQGGGPDFRFICTLAGLDPRWVKEQADAYITARRAGVELGKYPGDTDWGDE